MSREKLAKAKLRDLTRVVRSALHDHEDCEGEQGGLCVRCWVEGTAEAAEKEMGWRLAGTDGRIVLDGPLGPSTGWGSGGGEMKTLPFRPHFREAIETGRKTCTARTRRYGVPGETLDTIAGPILLTAVHKLPLAVVRDHYWRQEGCDSPEHFEQVWNEIHPRKAFDPEQKVWLHLFVRTTKEGEGS